MSQNRPDDYDRIVTSLLLSGTVLIYKSQNRPDDYDRIVTHPDQYDFVHPSILAQNRPDDYDRIVTYHWDGAQVVLYNYSE